jgi:hypothetical protein
MTKKPSASEQTQPECLNVLQEFVGLFERTPQRYCLFCRANAALAPEAHKSSCPVRRATKLIGK